MRKGTDREEKRRERREEKRREEKRRGEEKRREEKGLPQRPEGATEVTESWGDG